MPAGAVTATNLNAIGNITVSSEVHHHAESAQSRRRFVVFASVIIVALAAIAWLLEGLLGGQKFDAPRIRAHFVESSERQRDADLAAADTATPSDERQRLRDAAHAAHAAHAARLARIDDAVSRFRELEGGPDATRVGRELTRILAGEGADAALAYIEREKAGLLAEADAQLASDRERLRRKLAPLLSAADLQVNKGDAPAARRAYRELLQRDPAWPAALRACAWFLYDQSFQHNVHGTLIAALADAEEAHTLAIRLHTAKPGSARAQRLLSVTHHQMGDVLLKRGQEGDAAKVESHYALSLELADALLAANPGSADAKRDVSVSLDRLGDFLATRAQSGDMDKALDCFTRSLEIDEALLAANPGSAQVTRDVSVSLSKLGDFLATREQPGDEDKALDHFTRSFGMKEKLLAANPGSAEATRDVSVSLDILGDFFATRGQPGDMDKALDHFTRSFDMKEKLLAANPGSAQAKRDVSVSLNTLGHFYGDFINRRMQPGDADKARSYLIRSLELDEMLLAENPASAEAMRNVSISLKILGDFLTLGSKSGDFDKALRCHMRSLELNEKLLAANPDSAQAIRDVALSHDKIARFSVLRWDAASEARHSRAMYGLLKPAIERGMTFDPPTLRIYEDLKARFSGK